MKENNKNTFIKNIALCAMFSVLVYLPTRYVQIPMGTGQYLHFGDAMIYIAACVLPFPFGSLAGLIGGSLADLLSGYGYWAPFTAVIKFLIALPFTSKSDKILTKRNCLVSIASGLISSTCYYLSTVIIMRLGMGTYEAFNGSVKALFIAAAIDGLSFIQSIGSIIFFLIIGFALDKAGFKKYIKKIS